MNLSEKVEQSINFIEKKLGKKPQPEIGLILGSGLGVYADDLVDTVEIEFSEIPHFSKTSVVGHKGKMIFGNVHGKEVVLLQGRFHFYEGNGMEAVTYPIRVFTKLGIKVLFTTNATGGINESFKPGDFMIITDHINLLGPNPLIGENDSMFGVRFPDMSAIYDKELINVAKEVASSLDIPIKEGVMGGYSGPSFETPAEVRMYKMLGCDNVGMSTIPETIVARHGGVRVLSISAITNMAVGICKEPLNHDEVLAAGNAMLPIFKQLVDNIIKEIVL